MGKPTFAKYGPSYHLRIRTAADLENVLELDEAHWVATNAPISTINCDEVFLRLMDLDENGRILCFEVQEAIRWLLRLLRETGDVTERSQTLRLDAVNTDTPEGQRILEAASKILTRQGSPDAKDIALDDVRQVKAQAESTPVSEAGVVLPEAAEAADVRQFIADVVATVGGAPHPSGAKGAGEAELNRFLTEAAAYLDWHDRGVVPPGQDKTDIMPLGVDTPAAFALLSSLRGKIDQYFAQCEALNLDERFVQRMGWTEAELQGLDFDDPAVIEEVLRRAPLAKANPARQLRFDQQVNPYYAEPLERFRQQVLKPVLGDCGDALSARQWQEVRSAFVAHQAWVEGKAGAAVEALGPEKLRGYLDERFASEVRALIAESTRTALVLDNIRLIEKLILYQAHMLDLVNNFVSFPHLYDAHSRAMFEMGTLVMDGRRFSLAVKVENRTQHAEVAKTSNMFLLYVQIAPKEGKPIYEVAVPVTSGSKGNLCIGKRGIFYDLAERQFDARVVDIIENPISLREALASPFRRLGRLLTGKIEALTTAAEKKLDAQAAQAMAQAAPQGGPQQQARPSTAGLLMGGSLAVAALGSALAYITKTLSQTHPLAIVAGLLGAVVLVMLPTSIIAILKLRRRDLSAILEGSGWGINARMRLTRRQGRFFTQRPRYPIGAKRLLAFWWKALLIVLLILAILAGVRYGVRRAKNKPPPTTQQALVPAETSK